MPFEHTLVLQYTIWAHTRAAMYHLRTHSCCNVQFEHTLVLQYTIWAHTRAAIYNLSTHSCYNIPFEHTLVLQYTIWILSHPCATKDPVGTHLHYKNALQLLPKLDLIIKNTSGKHLAPSWLPKSYLLIKSREGVELKVIISWRIPTTVQLNWNLTFTRVWHDKSLVSLSSYTQANH